ncbi:50S ribosomal protein L11 methyltransferase [Roseivirga sp.]|uniref:50S ribosomal protein L11 methyltransferase n=1 Tax=Roseivirga sp. TaxID=1964215 RepID=UPI003B51603C
MDFIQINVHCDQPFREILIAEMGELDFETFMDTEVGFEAYISEEQFSHPALQTLFNRYRKQTRIWYELKKIPRENWNEEWEKNYSPIAVGDKIFVRATFHPARPEVPYEIIINPQMSFGTGHHETTHQLLALQLELDHQGKKVLDVGSGTGILAIMAAKLGAKSVAATDIDDWCIENALENLALNQVEAEFVKQGTIHELQLNGTYEIILANINTHVLLDEMEAYTKLLADQGHLFLSGFYESDKPQIMELAGSLGLKEVKFTTEKNWVALLLEKV